MSSSMSMPGHSSGAARHDQVPAPGRPRTPAPCCNLCCCAQGTLTLLPESAPPIAFTAALGVFAPPAATATAPRTASLHFHPFSTAPPRSSLI